MKKKIVIAADHGGFELKNILVEWLKKEGHTVIDQGTNSKESVDYPDYARAVATAISTGEATEGILICSSGVGMSIAANRFPGIRASLCYNEEIAVHTRMHNLSNVICLGAHYVSEDEAKKITSAWLKTKHGKKDRYIKRAFLIDEYSAPRCSGCF